MAFHQRILVPLAVLGVVCVGASAADISFSGFANITGGYVFSGSPTPGQYSAGTTVPWVYQPNAGNAAISYKCPCFVGNYEYAGVYRYREVDFSPETSIGMQAQVKINADLTATIQAVARGADGYKADIDWAYIGYKLPDDWTIQAGHKRLPIYNYSDYMYVGYSYPWVRPPQDLYGWQIYSYDGINVMKTATFGAWSATFNVWAGSKTDSDNRTLGLLYYGDTIHEAWKNIVGAYADFNHDDEFDIRIVAMTNKVDRTETLGTVTTVDDAGVGQKFFGASFNLDKNDWVVRTEANFFERPTTHDYYRIYLGSVGYRFVPNWSGYVTRSGFYETYPNGPEKHYTNTATLRWDFRRDADLKLQFDSIHDHSLFPFTGTANMVSASLNATF